MSKISVPSFLLEIFDAANAQRFPKPFMDRSTDATKLWVQKFKGIGLNQKKNKNIRKTTRKFKTLIH